MYFTDTYLTDIKPVMQDWLTNSLAGNSVSDLPLNFTNRAQQSLWAEKPWSQLEVFTEMTLSGNDYTVPDAVGRIVRIAEYDSYGQMIVEYKEGDDPNYGYSIDWAFTMAAGYAGTITFNSISGSGTLKITYIKALDNFTGVADTTEYSYFPATLILLAAQKLSALEKGNVGEYQGIMASYAIELKKFENATHNVNVDTRPIMRDRAGNHVSTPGYSLGDMTSRSRSPYSNKRIC